MVLAAAHIIPQQSTPNAGTITRHSRHLGQWYDTTTLLHGALSINGINAGVFDIDVTACSRIDIIIVGAAGRVRVSEWR
jgi:hypothetical protein